MQSRNAHRQTFPSVETIESWTSSGDFIELSPEAILQNGNNGAVRVIFTAFNELDQILLPIKSNSRWVSTSKNQKRFVNSRIIAASLGRGRHVELPKPVKITFRHLQVNKQKVNPYIKQNINKLCLHFFQDVNPSVVRPECVYWDYVSNAWSDEGCHAILSNVTHTQCSCTHLTNFALLMSPILNAATNPEEEDLNDLKPVMAPTSKVKASWKAHVSTIVASVATLISVFVILFFAAIAVKRFKPTQCRLALQNSGLPCFHKGKEINSNSNGNGDKDKGNNKGNFYTVTPKLNGGAGSGNGGLGGEPVDEVAEAQQFFEHMINLQKNETNTIRTMRRSHSHNLNNAAEINPEAEDKVSNLEKIKNNIHHAAQQSSSSEVAYPKRSNYARALSPLNHIYMEITDQKEDQLNQQQPPVYEPLTHSETYLMSTRSDFSEDNYNYLNNHNSSEVSRQSSARETRPLINGVLSGGQENHQQRNLLQTISGVLHSQSVRIAPNGNVRGCATLHQPIRRNISSGGVHATLARFQPQNEVPLQITNMNGSDFVRLNLDSTAENHATYIASTTSDLGLQQPAGQQASAYLGQQIMRANAIPVGTVTQPPQPMIQLQPILSPNQRQQQQVVTSPHPQTQVFASEI